MPKTLTPPSPQQRLAERSRPPGTVVMYQRWEHVLFLHWRFHAATVQATLPRGLTVDTWNDSAWLGLVPLFMRDVRPRFVPAMPAISDFLELNLRTYVYDALGRPGVYFYSLDCDQPLAVEMARRFLNLNYEHCAMTAAAGVDGWVNFEAQRQGTKDQSAFRYRAMGKAIEADPSSLDFFLIERYRLFTGGRDTDNLKSIQVCHAPYRIRAAEVTAWGDAPIRQAAFQPPGRNADHVCTVDGVDVETFAPHSVE